MDVRRHLRNALRNVARRTAEARRVAGYGDGVSADNVGWCRWMPYDVALYVRERDYELEKRFEAALDAAEFNYNKTVTSLDGDELVETAYEIDVTE